MAKVQERDMSQREEEMLKTVRNVEKIRRVAKKAAEAKPITSRIKRTMTLGELCPGLTKR